MHSAMRWRGGRVVRRILSMWIVIIVLLGIALMIPITAILLDSPLGRSMARRLEGPTDGSPGSVRELERRVEALETDIADLTRSVTGMREEIQFVHGLLEDPKQKRTRRRRRLPAAGARRRA